MIKKKKIAVFFGGRSPEHDVSIVSGLQIFQALDRDLFDPFPVYVTTNGRWYVGDALKERKNYFFTEQSLSKLTEVKLDVTAGTGVLLPVQQGFFGKKEIISFDMALPIFHGLYGEDGNFQGMMEFANIPYAGMRGKPCAVYMDKDSTKKALAGSGVGQLPHVSVNRPGSGLLVPKEELEAKLKGISFPCCVKPANLGSSIGVAKAEDVEQVRAVLANIFKMDTKAIIEPFVSSRIEYNVAVRVNRKGRIETSAIERPKSTQELLDFKEKYLSGGGGKKGVKTAPATTSSEGMLSLTRDINPQMNAEMEEKIRSWATIVFDRFDAAGAPRIDFMGDTKTGEIWFNELNPIPGSYGYFLWEAAKTPVLFTEFLTDLINEAETLHARRQIPSDPVPEDARLFKR